MNRIYWVLSVLLVVASFSATIWVYPTLPDRIPTHWNLRGEVDGHRGKATLFLLPAVMVGLLSFFACLPALSPKPFEVDSFRSTYLYIMLLTLGWFAYMNGAGLYATDQIAMHGAKVDLGRIFIAGLFLYTAFLGNVLGKVKRNFYIGIRVPWTLASDRVWNDTHRLAGWLMAPAGVVGFLAVLVGTPVLLAIALLIATALIPVIYSFIHYKALERAGAL